MTYDVAKIAERFHDDGFALVSGFLEKDEVDEFEREVNRYIEHILPTVSTPHVFYESGSSGPIKHFSRLELHDAYFKRFFHRPATIELLEACMGSDVEPITSEVFYKPALVGSPALYHQDNAYFNYLPPYGLVVWIALDDTTLENGAVHFARGSHRLGDLPHDFTEIPLFTRALATKPDTNQYPEVPSLLKRGDASIHHFLTVHRSGANKTDKNRRGFVLDYRSSDAVLNEDAYTQQEAHKDALYKDSDT